MEVLGVLLGITMCALVGVCLYADRELRELKEQLDRENFAIKSLIQRDWERLTALEKNTIKFGKEPFVTSEDTKNPRTRARTMSDAIREAEEESTNPLNRR